MHNYPKIAIPLEADIYFFDPSEILYCLEEGGFANMILQNDRRFVLQITLVDVAQLLPDSFLRIHPSYLINSWHLVRFTDNGSSNVYMSDGEILPMSRGYKRSFLQFFQIR